MALLDHLIIGDAERYYRFREALKRGVTPRMADQPLQPLFDAFASEAPQRSPKDMRPRHTFERSLVPQQRMRHAVRISDVESSNGLVSARGEAA